MNKLSLSITVAAFMLLKSLSGQSNQIADLKPVLGFMENKGQIADQYFHPRPDVLFAGTTGQMAFHVRNNGISYQLNRVDAWQQTADHRTPIAKKEVSQQSIYRVDINWVNANAGLKTLTDAELPGLHHYYMAQCPDGALNVKTYSGVTFKNLYDGIDLHYCEKKGQLKYDYVVAPFAAYDKIILEVKGATIIAGENGEVILRTPLGDIEEGKPLVYQKGRSLPAKWIINKNKLSFEIENYDPAYELLIDPLTRSWGTYFGGSEVDEAAKCATDAAGNVYLAGNSQTTGNGIIATAGAHQSVFAGVQDAFLVKFNSSGARQWSTYYGGAATEYGSACAADASGRVYLAGYTTSSGGTSIATPGSHQPAYAGNPDTFLAQFNSNGIRQWATYYGGNYNDYSSGCMTDPSGNVFMAGYTATNGGTGIATPGSHQATHGGSVSDYDAFLVKFDAAGNRLWGTYYGGAASEYGNSCATDALGNVYLTGFTQSAAAGGSEIATIGAHQINLGGFADAFLVKFNASGVRQWGTYYGGNGDDVGNACITDAAGNVYLPGYTQTATGNIIATNGSHQSAFGGDIDAFLVKFNTAGVRQWGTYYGGVGIDIGASCAVDNAGYVYFSGETKSSGPGLIATPNGFQLNASGGFDAFLVQFNPGGQRIWGTYYGGFGDDFGYSCVTDQSANVYLAGTTSSGDANTIATQGTHQVIFGGINDGFVARFACAQGNPTVSANNPACVGSPINFTTSVTTTITLAYSWSGPNAYTSLVQSPVIVNAQFTDAGTYSLLIEPGSSCTQTTSITIAVDPCTGLADVFNETSIAGIYPNPNNGNFVVDVKVPANLIIMSSLGQVIATERLKEGKNDLKLPGTAPGIYILQVENNSVKQMFRMIKE
ncbi:MAG: SBBP repeat-containing protein [Bacteroidota bacterium]